MGSIYKRGEVYWILYYSNGKRFRESAESKKESDAKTLLKKREGETASGKLPGIYFDRVRFDELADDLLLDYRVNGYKTYRMAELRIRLHLKPFFGNVRIPEINTPKIKAYTQLRLDEEAANGTINRELAILKRLLNLGARCTPPKVDRVPHIPMLAENNARKGFFEQDEYKAVRDTLPACYRGFVTFGYKTGWRLSEISGLTWDQVDLKKGIVRLEVGETKNKEARTVYLDSELKDIFSECFIERRLDCQFVFHRDGQQIKTFRKAWNTACREVGLEGRLFHDLRRTAVRNMIRAGIPERVAMMISGHKTRAIFDRYNIVSEQDLKAAAKKQEAYLES